MPVTVQMRTVIGGGGGIERPVAPQTDYQAAGSLFLGLSKSDRKLQNFIGAPVPATSTAPLAHDAFFGDLLKMRNAARDVASGRCR